MSAEAKKATLAKKVNEDITLIYPRTLADIVMASDNTTVQDKINAFQNNINTLNSSVGDINTSIASLSDIVTNNKSNTDNEILNLSQRINNLKGANILLGTDDNTTVQVAIDDINYYLDTLNASNVKYSSGAETVKDRIDNLNTGNIIYSGNTKLSTKLGNIDSAISSLQTDIALSKVLINANAVNNKYPANEIFCEDYLYNTAESDVNDHYMFMKGQLICIANKPIMFRLEKILVDILCDNALHAMTGSESYAIYATAFDRYSIGRKALLRYAGRRNRKEEVETILNEIGK